MTFDLVLEWIAVILNLAFLYFAMKEKVVAWPLGIVASVILAYLFFMQKVYLEGVIYIFYVAMGVYGWHVWAKDKDDTGEETGIIAWNTRQHLNLIIIGSIISVFIGGVFDRYTDEKYPFLDAFSTVFQFFATYLEAKKVLSAWIYWIILNLFGIWFYHRLGFDTVAIQMIVFTVFSVVGYLQWRKRYQTLEHLH